MITTTNIFKNWAYDELDRDILFRVEFDGLDTGEPLDVSNWVISRGTVSRKMDYITGKFTPGGNTFKLSNSELDGTYLFNLRNTINGTDLPGTDYWQGESYNIYLGKKEDVGTVTVTGYPVAIPTMGLGHTTAATKLTPATLGYGTSPSNVLAPTAYSEETIHVYEGRVNKRVEDRIRETVNLSSNDIFKILNDTKINGKITNTDALTRTPSPEDDLGATQQTLMYGQHIPREMNISSPLVTNWSKSPEGYSSIEGISNSQTVKPTGSSETRRSGYRWWYFPTTNPVDTDEMIRNLLSQDNFCLFWDYKDGLWRAFYPGAFSNAKLLLHSSYNSPTSRGFYLEIVDSNLQLSDLDWFTNSDWTDYTSGQGNWAAANDNIDVKIRIGTLDDAFQLLPTPAKETDSNPVNYIYHLLTEFAGIDASLIDCSGDFSSPDTNFTFDYAYNNTGEMNTDFRGETSVMEVINKLTLEMGYMLVCNQKKESTSESLSGADRRIKLIPIEPYVHATDEPVAELTYSTNREVQKFSIDSDNQRLKNKVEILNADPTDKMGEFGTYTASQAGAGTPLSIETDTDVPQVYWYDEDTLAQTTVDNYLSKLGVPWEWINITLDVRGVVIELGDFIKIYDHKMNEEIVLQVYTWKLNLADGRVDISGKKVWSSLD